MNAIKQTHDSVSDKTKELSQTQAASLKESERLIPLSEWPNHHAWPPIGGLRHLVFNAQENGFDKVIRRVGRRVLIHEGAFFTWVENLNAGSQRDDA